MTTQNIDRIIAIVIYLSWLFIVPFFEQKTGFFFARLQDDPASVALVGVVLIFISGKTDDLSAVVFKLLGWSLLLFFPALMIVAIH